MNLPQEQMHPAEKILEDIRNYTRIHWEEIRTQGRLVSPIDPKLLHDIYTFDRSTLRHVEPDTRPQYEVIPDEEELRANQMPPISIIAEGESDLRDTFLGLHVKGSESMFVVPPPQRSLTAKTHVPTI